MTKDFEDTDGDFGFQPRPPDNLGREDFKPLGAPIRKPAPIPNTRKHLHGDIYQRADGKLETVTHTPGRTASQELSEGWEP